MAAFDFDVCRSVMPHGRVGTRIHYGTVLCGPCKSYTIFTRELLHIFTDFDFSHTYFDEVESFLEDFISDLHCLADALQFGWSLASAQGVDDWFGTDASFCIGCASQILFEELVHGVSQTVSVDV